MRFARQEYWSGLPVPSPGLSQINKFSSAGKQSTCNVGDPGSIPGSGRSLGEGIGYPLQCSWASLLAKLVKNPPAMRETWVRSLGWEINPLEKGKPTWVFWPGEFHGQSMGSLRVRHNWATFTTLKKNLIQLPNTKCNEGKNSFLLCVGWATFTSLTGEWGHITQQRFKTLTPNG